MLLVSSASVYGNPARLPVAEDAILRPVSPYGAHKRLQEAMLLRAVRGGDVAALAARVFSTYGPGLRRLAVWDICRRALSGDPTVHGDGTESRDYLHVRDVARALVVLAETATFDGSSINVGSGRETMLAELARAVHLRVGLRSAVRWTGAQEAGKPVRWCADVAKLRVHGFEPSVELVTGLAETIDWIRAHA